MSKRQTLQNIHCIPRVERLLRVCCNNRLLDHIGSHLHNRSLELSPRPDDIIQHRSRDHRCHHYDAIIHMRRARVIQGREKAEDKNDNPEKHREDVDHNSKDAGEMERSPNERAKFGGVVNVAS